MAAKIATGRSYATPYWASDRDWVKLYSGDKVQVLKRLPSQSVHLAILEKVISEDEIGSVSDICHASWGVLREDGLLCLLLWNSVDKDRRYLITPSCKVVGALQQKGWYICRTSKAGEGLYVFSKSQRPYIKELDGKDSSTLDVINSLTSLFGCCPKCGKQATGHQDYDCQCLSDTSNGQEYFVPCTVLDLFASRERAVMMLKSARRYVGVSLEKMAENEIAGVVGAYHGRCFLDGKMPPKKEEG